MIKQWLAVVFSASILSVCVPAYAEAEIVGASSDVPSYTLKSYIDTYLAESLKVKQYVNTFRKAENTYKNAFVDTFLPSFSLGLSGSSSKFKDTSESGSFSASWDIYSIGKYDGYETDRLTYEAAEISFESSIQGEVLSAVNYYYDLMLEKKLMKIYEQDLANAKKQYEQDLKLYNNGLSESANLLQSEASYKSSQLSYMSSKNDYADKLKDFNIAINRPPEEEVIVDEKVNAEIPDLPPLEEDYAYAVKHSYSIRQDRITLKTDDINTRKSLNTNYLSASVDMNAGTGRSFDYSDSWDWTYGISASIGFDLGFFGIDKKREKENILYAAQNDKLTYEQNLRDLRSSVIASRNSLIYKKESIDVYKLKYQISQEKFDKLQEKYKSGAASATDLSVARDDLIEAQINYEEQLCNITIAEMSYKNTLGKPIYEYKVK